MIHLKKLLRGTQFSLRMHPSYGGYGIDSWDLRCIGRTWFHFGARDIGHIDPYASLWNTGLLVVGLNETAREDDIAALRALLVRYARVKNIGVYMYRGGSPFVPDCYDPENEVKAQTLVLPGQYREHIAA